MSSSSMKYSEPHWRMTRAVVASGGSAAPASVRLTAGCQKNNSQNGGGIKLETMLLRSRIIKHPLPAANLKCTICSF